MDGETRVQKWKSRAALKPPCSEDLSLGTTKHPLPNIHVFHSEIKQREVLAAGHHQSPTEQITL